jgi:hypothetical protein
MAIIGCHDSNVSALWRSRAPLILSVGIECLQTNLLKPQGCTNLEIEPWAQLPVSFPSSPLRISTMGLVWFLESAWPTIESSTSRPRWD